MKLVAGTAKFPGSVRGNNMGKFIIFFIATMARLTMGWRSTYNIYERTTLGDSVDRASMKLLKEVYETSSDKNVVTSPLGVLTLLTLYVAGSEGENREEIMKLLGYTDYKELSKSYSELTDRFARMDPSYLNLASKVFVSDKYSLNDDFSKTARSFNAEVGSLNFGHPKSAADIINEWSSANTQGKISHPVSASDIDVAAAVALFNIIFFQGHWHVPFNASETKEQDFHTSRGKTVKKPMMHLLRPLHYYKDKDIGARMIELPYKEDKFRMIIVLPDVVEGLPEVVRKISEKGMLEDVFRMHPVNAEIDLDMPKFEIKSKHDFKDVLTKVGVSSIFHKPANGIVKDHGVVVDKVFQEAFVKVDEEGATAGAFTGAVAVLTSSHSMPPPPVSFKVDRPFLYAILHEDIILFAGTYSS